MQEYSTDISKFKVYKRELTSAEIAAGTATILPLINNISYICFNFLVDCRTSVIGISSYRFTTGVGDFYTNTHNVSFGEAYLIPAIDVFINVTNIKIDFTPQTPPPADPTGVFIYIAYYII